MNTLPPPKFSHGALVQVEDRPVAFVVERYLPARTPFYEVRSLTTGSTAICREENLRALQIPERLTERKILLWSLLDDRERFLVEREKAIFVSTPELGSRLWLLEGLSSNQINKQLDKLLVRHGLDPKDGSPLTVERMRELAWEQKHKDFKGTYPDGTRAVLKLVEGKGTCLVPLDSLTVEDLRQCLGIKPST